MFYVDLRYRKVLLTGAVAWAKAGKEHGLRIDTLNGKKRKIFYCLADSEQERQEWLTVFRNIMRMSLALRAADDSIDEGGESTLAMSSAPPSLALSSPTLHICKFAMIL